MSSSTGKLGKSLQKKLPSEVEESHSLWEKNSHVAL